MGATIKDVARVAGVSISTVSRVINGNYPVSEATRKRVQVAIESCKYVHNPIARSMVTRKTATLGITGTDILNPYFAEMLHYIQEGANELSYQVLFQGTGSVGREKRAIQTLIHRRVDGLIMMGHHEETTDFSHIVEAAATLPTVLIGMPIEASRVHVVHARERKGMLMLAKELLRQNHRNFLFLGGATNSFPTDQRLGGLRDALSSMNDYRLEVELTGFSYDHNLEIMHEMVEKRGLLNWCTAIVCINDYVAMSALSVLHAHGVRVPEMVSVTGFDNVLPSRITLPSLTTVDLQKEELAKLAVGKLLQVIKEPDQPATHVSIPTMLVLRNSHGEARRTQS